MNSIALLATLTCPNPACQHQQQVLMPTTSCQLTYTCERMAREQGNSDTFQHRFSPVTG